MRDGVDESESNGRGGAVGALDWDGHVLEKVERRVEHVEGAAGMGCTRRAAGIKRGSRDLGEDKQYTRDGVDTQDTSTTRSNQQPGWPYVGTGTGLARGVFCHLGVRWS